MRKTFFVNKCFLMSGREIASAISGRSERFVGRIFRKQSIQVVEKVEGGPGKESQRVAIDPFLEFPHGYS